MSIPFMDTSEMVWDVVTRTYILRTGSSRHDLLGLQGLPMSARGPSALRAISMTGPTTPRIKQRMPSGMSGLEMLRMRSWYDDWYPLSAMPM
jgi:hypothetical protein